MSVKILKNLVGKVCKLKIEIIALQELSESPSGDSPGGFCASRGDLLVVRSISERQNAEWPLAVTHEHRTDANFFMLELVRCVRLEKLFAGPSILPIRCL